MDRNQPTNETVERRFLPSGELRAVESDGQRRLEGYAARFNERSEWLWGFYEMILPGAFRNVLANNDVRALYNHDPSLVLGRTANGTLLLEEDNLGLRYIITLPDTATGNEVWTLVQRGDISQSSFAFEVSIDGEEWGTDGEGGPPLRKIRTVARLYDVSPVTYPAYPATSVHARAMAASLTEHGETDAPTREEHTAEVRDAVLLTQAAARQRQLRLLALSR